MKVLALIDHPGHVCYRYRIEAFAAALFDRGMELETVALQQGRVPRVLRLPRAARADVVVLQRRLLPAWQLGVLRRFAKRLVYDVDDAVFQRSSRHADPTSVRRMKRFRATVRLADVVVAGNEYLRQRAEVVAGGGRAVTVPTTVSPGRYRLARHERRGAAARLVWIGSASTLRGLEMAGTHFAAIGQRLDGVELRIVSDRTASFDGVRTTLRRWSQAGEAAELADGDIGVSWLADDSWSRGKCGLKVLQYMAAGLPVVANRVGANCEMVVDGVTGLLVDTPEQWAEATARLAYDPGLRGRMGAAGRRMVEERYSVETWGPRFAGLLKGIAEDRPVDQAWRAAEPVALDSRPKGDLVPTDQ